MIEKAKKREQIFEAMQLARLEQVFLYPTKTGLEKSIFDATRSISHYFYEIKYHDYYSQPKGPEHKRKLECKLIFGREIVDTTISLYRPNTKDGDNRFWISSIDKYTQAGDVVALLVRQNILFAANMSVSSIENLMQCLPVNEFGDKPIFSYDQVNYSINKFIVSGYFTDKPLYLDFDGIFAQNVSEYLNVEMEQLSELIFHLAKEKLCFDKSNPFSDLNKENDNWWANKFSFMPPSSLFLFALTLVAERMSSDDRHSLNNYYDRLIKCFGISSDADNRSLRAHFKSTEKYWFNFNAWLFRNDGRYGIATAKPIISKWKYVSYPISQALLRKGDKENIRHFLTERKLDKETEIEFSQLADLLDRWLSSSASTKYLRELWKRQELRQLIVETARDELAFIKPNQDRLNRTKSLRLGLRISNFPVQYLHPFIFSNRTFNDQVQIVERLKGSAVFGDVNLTNIEESFSIFGPPENISIENLLLSGIEISTEDNQRFAYKPKQIFALQRNEHGYFLQVDRPRILEDYILVGIERNNLKNQTKSFLDFCAAQGYEFRDNVRGLPAGFFFVENVKFIRSVNENQWPYDDPNYYIRPSGSLSTLTFSNAIRLGRNILHTKSAPIFTFTFEGEEAGHVELNLITEESRDSESQKIEPSISGPVAEFELNASLNEDVNAEIKLTSPNGLFPEASFSFRDSSQPRLDAPPECQYAIQYEAPARFLGCDELTEVLDSTLLSNSLFHNIQKKGDKNISLTTHSKYLDPQEHTQYAADEENVFQYSKNQTSPVSSSEQLSCMLGQHIWKIPDESSDGKWEAECSACGEERLFPVHKKFRQNSFLKREIVYSDNSIYAPIYLKSSAKTYTPETILDAIHYLQELGFTKFTELCREISNENLFAFELLNAFWILGDVDCSLDPRTLKPARIFSAAPTLFKVDGGYVLRGFKNKELIEKLTEILGPPDTDNPKFSVNPTKTYFFKSILQEGTDQNLLDVTDVFGRRLILSENFGELFVKQLFNFSSLFPFLPPISVSHNSNLEFFDSITAKWKETSNLTVVGAYRINWPFRQYFLVLKDRKTVACSADLAKIYSGYLNNVRYHNFEKHNCSFVSNLGCDLPPLIQRSLISFSGKMPIADNKGRKIFTDVPENFAMAIINHVYS